ncbi:MAG: GNAT family N-acetyltransferase [Anaerolineaceae bacterium]|jgi:ribosomal protein S18 acetylase RimI-like enzyme|nr:GNAT family N-acetyltransferase [Anaerolineaceae bacterium]MDD4043033.1 GNAT family N-acetyltransferase [Anaerolineaceae bacterium]MDD4577289.1 GNAT family N-acetyltransferase [Anaerolineaceae bacterium]
MNVTIRLLTLTDYPALFALWSSLPGFNRGLRSIDDSQEGVAKFLQRNPTTCFIAEADGQTIGGILAGHDGRRGYIYHALVHPDFQGKGIGKLLANTACDALKAEGITKAGMLVFASNEQGNTFWESQGWQTRPDLVYRNKTLNEENL